MICEECKKENQKSIIEVGLTATTAMYCAPFYDEEGVLHQHDRNVRTTEYSCSRGHRWKEGRIAKCPACGWPEEETAQAKTSFSSS
jgi:hypothetical protein